MMIEIKVVPEIVQQGYKKKFHVCGTTTIKSKGKVLIQIALDRNKDLAEFGITLLHEMLHVWISILKANGAPINLRQSHKFIYEAENQIANLTKYLKGK